MYHKRLAMEGRAAYGFLHQRHFEKHWDRYSAVRIDCELRRLMEGVDELLEGFHRLISDDMWFLLAEVDDLPDFLKEDFILARDLFSVGFDEVGVLAVGRGLEGVVRAIAREKELVISHNSKHNKDKESPACQARLYDLVEALYRVRWQQDGATLIDQTTRNLLHFLRSMRNRSAHPTRDSPPQHKNWREVAVIAARSAQNLWTEAKSRQGLAEKVIDKTW
ncbi:hypothetical protein MYX82_05090 [Acidobacteria bacterium AH-259-D05]|nr:hypothetical protein [Acidobacteria bacterium AH-259-D05]